MKDHAAPTILGRISALSYHPFSGGRCATMFSAWGHLGLSGFRIEFSRPTPYAAWGDTTAENLCLVESGEASLNANGKKYRISAGMALKLQPGQAPELIPGPEVAVVSIQMPVDASRIGDRGDLSKLLVVDPDAIPSRVYEYEALGKEVISCDNSPGLGLIHFVFPHDKIPLHRHPFAGRLIRTISGEGYAYVDGEYFSMNPDTFALFEKGVIHTNGPVDDSVYELWAVQLPWINPGMTDFEIGGDEDFVRYVEAVPSRDRWKTKQQLEYYRDLKSGKPHPMCSCCGCPVA